MRHTCASCSASQKPCNCDHDHDENSSSRRNGYSFKEGLTMMAAKAVGIDPYLAAEAGENARAAINALRNARKTKTAKDRGAFIREAQTELRAISPAKHGKLVNAIQAKLLALQGRGGDSEIAHLTPGEVVIPRSLQTPALMRTIAAEAARQGIDPARYTVGHRANRINPQTSAGEYNGCNPGDPGECGIGSFNNYNFPPIQIPPVIGIRPTPVTPTYNGGFVGVTPTFGAPPNINIAGEDSDAITGGNKSIEERGKEIRLEWEAMIERVSKNPKDATNEELADAWERANYLSHQNDNSVFDIMGALHGAVTRGPGASYASALKPLINYYQDAATSVLTEINARIIAGTWDIRVPGNESP